MPKIIPIKELKDTASISSLCSQTKEPIFITKNGYGDMVIMSMEAYEEKFLMLDVYTAATQGRGDFSKESLIAAKEVFDNLKDQDCIK